MPGTEMLPPSLPNTAGTPGFDRGLVMIDYLSGTGGIEHNHNAIVVAEQLAEREADLRDAALAISRILTDSGERLNLADLLEEFGYRVEELRARPSYSEE